MCCHGSFSLMRDQQYRGREGVREPRADGGHVGVCVANPENIRDTVTTWYNPLHKLNKTCHGCLSRTSDIIRDNGRQK
jgi:hypothetical protein